MSNTNNNISNPLNGCEVNRIPKIQYKETPKDKNASDYLEVKYPSGKKMVYSGYNVIDEPIIKEEGSMTRAQFEELHEQLSAKAERRISDMLVAQTKQVIEIAKETEQRISDILTTKFDQIEQKRLADKAEIKAEIKREINELRNEMIEMHKKDKEEAEEKRLADKAEMNQKFDLVFVTMESNQAQTNNRLDRIEEDIKMLKSFHEEDIKKYNKQKFK